MHKIIMVFAGLLFLNPVTAQYIINGKITDDKNHPLENAIVHIKKTSIETLSDSIGNFTINSVKAENELEIYLLGFHPKTITIKGNQNISIILEPAPAEFREVIVSGTSGETSVLRQSMAISLLSSKQLQLATSGNIIDALQLVPGINTISTGPNISKPVIRGLGGTRVLTLFNGVRQEGQQWGEEHGIEIDEFVVNKAEVLKGPASLIYGSDALGGVINLIAADPLKSGQVQSGIILNYQSNNGLAAISINTEGANERSFWGVRLSHKRAGNYTSPVDGKVFATSYSEYDVNAWTGIQIGKLKSRLNFSLYDNTQGVPSGDRDSASREFIVPLNESGTLTSIVSEKSLNSYEIPVIHQRVQHYRIQSLNQWKKLKFNLGWQQSTRREYSHPEFSLTPGLYLVQHSFTWDLRYNFNLNTIEYTVGMNGMLQSNTANGTEYLIPSYLQTDQGFFLIGRKDFGKTTVNAGVRIDYRNFHSYELYYLTNANTGLNEITSSNQVGAIKEFQEIKNSFAGWSAGIGMTTALTRKLHLKMNLGKGYRAPNVSELSASGVHPGTGIHQTGSSKLNPESNYQADAGVFLQNEHLFFSAEGFVNMVSNFTFNQKLSDISGGDSADIDGNIYYSFIQQNAILYGGETYLDFHPHPIDRLHIENTISLVWGQTIDSKSPLPLIPPFHIKTGIRYDFKNFRNILQGSYLKVEADHFEEQDRIWTINQTETKTPAYTLINVGVGSQLVSKNNHHALSLHISMNNLLNTSYQSHLSRLKYMEPYPNSTNRPGIWAPGRNISIKLIATF